MILTSLGITTYSTLPRKLKRSVGILAKTRHYLPISIRLQLYYTFIYPYLTYALTTWGNTYVTTLKSLITLQKKGIRLISFAEFRAHTSPLFSHLEILKLSDLIFLNNALLMYDFHENNLPPVFHDFFTPVSNVHKYNTRLASKDSYYISKVRTNYGKFSFRYVGAKVWNSIDDKQYLKYLLGYLMFFALCLPMPRIYMPCLYL